MGRESSLWGYKLIYSLIAISLVVITIILVTFNVIKGKWYTFFIYLSGLFMAYSTTMIGLSVVGSDISRELLMSNLAMNGWDLSLYDPSNSSVVVGWFVPFLSKITNIENVWIYKAVLPMIFAFTPVILYSIFKKQIGELKAFYASMFFIIVPVFSLEVATIGKSMVAETLMALTFWCMFTNWRAWVKFTVMLILTLLTLWAHYTIGILLIGFMVAILLVMLGAKLIPKWTLFRGTLPLWIPAVISVIGVAIFFVYYSNVTGGIIGNVVTLIGKLYIVQHKNAYGIPMNGSIAAFMNTDRILNASMGVDFFQVGWSGQAFRFIQYITQFLVVLGAVWILFKYKLYTFHAEFVACIGGAFVILLAVVAIPYFSSIINPTRDYHLALFFLAPCFVISFDAIEQFWKWAIK